MKRNKNKILLVLLIKLSNVLQKLLISNCLFIVTIFRTNLQDQKLDNTEKTPEKSQKTDAFEQVSRTGNGYYSWLYNFGKKCIQCSGTNRSDSFYAPNAASLKKCNQHCMWLWLDLKWASFAFVCTPRWVGFKTCSKFWFKCIQQPLECLSYDMVIFLLDKDDEPCKWTVQEASLKHLLSVYIVTSVCHVEYLF